jgi:hypothetical protein
MFVDLWCSISSTNIRQYYTTVLQTDGILILVQDEGELLVRSREETIATATTNIRQYYTIDPTTDGTNIPSLCGSLV